MIVNIETARIAGDDINRLTEEAMKYVAKERPFYAESIPKDLRKRRWTIVTHWSCILGKILAIFHDPDSVLTEEDMAETDSRIIHRKFKNAYSK